MVSRRHVAPLGLLILCCLAGPTTGRAAADVWRNIGPGGGYVRAVAVDPANAATLYAIAGEAFSYVFRSTDRGLSWSRGGGGYWSATRLAIDPITPTTLYVGTCTNYGRFNGGVWKSTDSAATWSPVNGGLTGDPSWGPCVSALAIDPTTPTTLYTAASHTSLPATSLFKTIDGGSSWQAASVGLGNFDIAALAIDPSATTTVYAAAYGGGIYRTTSGAGLWEAANDGLRDRSGAVADVHSLAIDPDDPRTVYAGTAFSGVFRSDDGGATWRAIGLNRPDVIVNALAIDPTAPRTVYAATDPDGVYKSTDGGSSWAPLGAGLEGLWVAAVAVDPTVRGRLFAATGAGVFVIDPSSGQPGCLGDLDDNGLVTVDELLVAVDILLGRQPLANHPGLDRDGSGTVEISEVIGAVRHALLGCR